MRQLKITKQITQRAEKSINSYFNDITRFSMITPEEEVELTIKIKSGDERALEKLVVANLRFVISVAKQYQNQGLSFADLINEGNYGLIKAATKFDETRGFKFISYAVWWIRQSIVQAISEQTRIVRLPLNRMTTINKVTKSIARLEQEFEREPTDDEIADYLEISDEDVITANNIRKRSVSLDKPLTEEANNDYSLYEFLKEENTPSPDETVMQESLTKNIKRALDKLSQREAQILIMSFGLFGQTSCPLHEIAMHYNMTSERIRQIRTTALLKLKMLLDGNHIFLTY